MPKLAQMTVLVNAFYVKTVAPARNDSQVSCVSGEATTELRRHLGAKPRFFPNAIPTGCCNGFRSCTTSLQQIIRY